jgi:hypothetical protein
MVGVLTLTFTAVCDSVIVTGASTVTAAVAVFVESVTDVAVTVTSADGLGTFGGAVYVTCWPEGLFAGTIVPQAAPVQLAPDSDQVTPWFLASLATVAVNSRLLFVTTPPPAAGVRVTLTPAGVAAVTVIAAAADLFPSATEVAVKVTLAGLGTLAGAA